jgi:hypothetical protein
MTLISEEEEEEERRDINNNGIGDSVDATN